MFIEESGLGQILVSKHKSCISICTKTLHTRYWINGQNVGETGNKPDPPGAADTATVVIGTAGGGGTRYFLGMIDEVRIWNRALSDEEINKQMEKGHFEIFPVDPKLKLTITWGNLKVQQR